MASKGDCRLLKKTSRDDGALDVVYEAALFNGNGYVMERCNDVWFPQRTNSDDTIRSPRLLNTDPSVSYYSKLMKALP